VAAAAKVGVAALVGEEYPVTYLKNNCPCPVNWCEVKMFGWDAVNNKLETFSNACGAVRASAASIS